MYTAIGLYLLIGILINLLIDLLFTYLEERNDTPLTPEELERFDNFTKFFIMLFWPIAVLWILLSIFNEYTK